MHTTLLHPDIVRANPDIAITHAGQVASEKPLCNVPSTVQRSGAEYGPSWLLDLLPSRSSSSFSFCHACPESVAFGAQSIVNLASSLPSSLPRLQFFPTVLPYVST